MLRINLKITGSGSTEPIPPPVGEEEYVFTLADDYLPPAGYLGLSDAQLKADSKYWPFDVFRKHRSHPLNKNLPATVTTLKKGSFTHNVSMVEYWADNCALSWFGVYSYKYLSGADRDAFNKAWKILSRGTEVITNDKGIENGYYDPVLGINEGATPIGIDALVTERGAYILHDKTREYKYGGIRGYLFVTLNGEQEAPDIRKVNCFTHPHLFSDANILMADEQRDDNGNLYPYLPNGHLGIDPFPMTWDFGGKTPIPNVSVSVSYGEYTMPAGINLIPTNRIALNPDGSPKFINYRPNPYNPELEF